MSTAEIISIILSVCTIGISVVALYISIRQGKRQNDLALLEKRIKLLEISRSLTEPISHSVQLFKGDVENKDDKPLFDIDFVFNLLTNSSFLEDIQGTANHPLDSSYQNKFLLKLEELRKYGDLFEMSFPSNIGNFYSDLCNLYVLLLNSAYKYAVCLNSLQKDGMPLSKVEDNKLEKETREAFKSSLNNTILKIEEIQKLDIYKKMKKITKVCNHKEE